MELIFFRHAYAGVSYNQENIMADFRRELTGSGIEELIDTLRASQDLFEDTEAIFTSPLVRAVQTAEIIHSFTPDAKLELLPELDKLSPLGWPLKFTQMLNQDSKYCFVGHEPQLSQVIGELLNEHSHFQLEKSGFAVLKGRPFDFQLSALISPILVKSFLNRNNLQSGNSFTT